LDRGAKGEIHKKSSGGLRTRSPKGIGGRYETKGIFQHPGGEKMPGVYQRKVGRRGAGSRGKKRKGKCYSTTVEEKGDPVSKNKRQT